MAKNCKNTFVLKTFGSKLYKWCPPPNESKKTLKQPKPYFCTAVAGSNGQDWISTYVYNAVVINNILEKQAYVECGYVE
jgi:hypothetical protein